MPKFKSLSKKQERELLTLAQKGEGHEKANAIRILIFHNRNLVKNLVKRYFFFFPGLDYEELVAEGERSLPKAIEKFDLSYPNQFGVYAGRWIKQHINAYIEKTQYIKRSSAEGSEKRSVIFYDSDYQNEDKESKSYSLADTLRDSENFEINNEQIRQHDIALKTNNLINSLENPEMILLVRLLHKKSPQTLLDIYYMADEEEKKTLLSETNLEGKRVEKSLAKIPWEGKKFQNLPLIQKYSDFFSRPHSFPEIVQIMAKSESHVRKLKQNSFNKLKKLAKEEDLRFLLI